MEDKWKYARYFALAKEKGLTEDNRRDLVRRFTNERTDSMAEMSRKEYIIMCNCIEYNCSPVGYEILVRSRRAECIRLMDKIGVHQWWSARDKFCIDPRIAGKRFALLNPTELDELKKKLYAILNKPQKERETMSTEAAAALCLNYRKNDTIS